MMNEMNGEGDNVLDCRALAEGTIDDRDCDCARKISETCEEQKISWKDNEEWHECENMGDDDDDDDDDMVSDLRGKPLIGHQSHTTSCLEFISSVHGKRRRFERDIEQRSLQEAVKYGTKKRQITRNGTDRYKFVYNGIVYITEADCVTEVTSYSLNQIPLERVPIDRDLEHEIFEQRRRIKTGESKITSHAVLVIDHSGSMKEGDLFGHRTRSRGAFYSVATEMIEAQLRQGAASFTDVVSVIVMREGIAQTIIRQEPTTWELYNKIVELAEDPFLPRGHAYYGPALQEATAALKSTDGTNVASLLIFLSDGAPCEDDLREGFFSPGVDQFLRNISVLCRHFRSRLSFCAFGFAQDSNYGRANLLGLKGKRFDLLRSMAEIAGASGTASSIFASGLETDSLRKALLLTSTSMHTTRTHMSSLAGGTLFRTIGTPKVKRLDLIAQDSDVRESQEEKFDVRLVSQGLKLWTGWVEAKKWDVQWNERKELRHPDAVGIAVNKKFFGIGAERAAFEGHEVNSNNEKVGQPFVAKKSIYEEPSQIDFHKRCAITQFHAKRIAKVFNKTIDESINSIIAQSSKRKKIPCVTFLKVWFYTFPNEEENIDCEAILCERRLNRFKKWNDNKGGIDGVAMASKGNKARADLEEDDEEKKLGVDKTVLHNADISRIIDDDIPQAFSHFSYQYTHQEYVICDLQGELGEKWFYLTDPAIHSEERQFGPTDHGRKGQEKFFRTHKCNELCRALGLRKNKYQQ
jgi:hypothetical protein